MGSEMCIRDRLRSVILTWKGKKPNSKIQETARKERYNLLFDYCKENQISDLFIGHHLDDQIENFIFRMFRGSGIVGLTSFSNFSKRDGINLIRPLIEIPKSDLLLFAKKQKIKWVEDPSNLNLNFDRIKIRNTLQNFYDSGFDKKLFLKSINKLKTLIRPVIIKTQKIVTEIIPWKSNKKDENYNKS